MMMFISSATSRTFPMMSIGPQVRSRQSGYYLRVGRSIADNMAAESLGFTLVDALKEAFSPERDAPVKGDELTEVSSWVKLKTREDDTPVKDPVNRSLDVFLSSDGKAETAEPMMPAPHRIPAPQGFKGNPMLLTCMIMIMVCIGAFATGNIYKIIPASPPLAASPLMGGSSRPGSRMPLDVDRVKAAAGSLLQRPAFFPPASQSSMDDSSVELSIAENIAYTASAAVTSTLGYGIYWFFTQG